MAEEKLLPMLISKSKMKVQDNLITVQKGTLSPSETQANKNPPFRLQGGTAANRKKRLQLVRTGSLKVYPKPIPAKAL